GVTDAIDPLGGSWYLEHLCDELEDEAGRLMQRIEDLGGAVRAIEAGFVQREIEESAYLQQQEIERGDRKVVGVNVFRADEEAPVPVQQIDPEVQRRREAELAAFRAARDGAEASAALRRLRAAAEGQEPLFPLVKEALGRRATLGEVSQVLREVWGTYRGCAQ